MLRILVYLIRPQVSSGVSRPFQVHVRYWPLIGFVSLACRSDFTAADTSQAIGLRPSPAPPMAASYDYGVAAQVPPGAFHCRRADDFYGPDHARVVYLARPVACAPTGIVAAAQHSTLPSLTVYYSFNMREIEHANEFRAARTATELAEENCPHDVRRFEGVRLLEEQAVGCWTEHDGQIDVSVEALYDLDRPSNWTEPNAMLGVRLVTTRSRLEHDWPVFVRFAASVYLCATEWAPDSSGKTIWIGAAPGRPECPPNGFW